MNFLRVPPGDPAALRNTIRTLWADPHLCGRIGAAGRRLVVECHGLDQWAAALPRAVAEAVALRARRDARAATRGRWARRTTVRVR